jgi:DNA-binding transcriptional regulator YiaG
VSVRFRNVDADWADPIETWPYEALVTTIERGLVPDWQPIFQDIENNPWGRTARRLEAYLGYSDHVAEVRLFGAALERARARQLEAEKEEVAKRVRSAIEHSGLSQAEFSKRIGTSPSRLSTYASGQVVPQATMLVRIENEASKQPAS